LSIVARRAALDALVASWRVQKSGKKGEKAENEEAREKIFSFTLCVSSCSVPPLATRYSSHRRTPSKSIFLLLSQRQHAFCQMRAGCGSDRASARTRSASQAARFPRRRRCRRRFIGSLFLLVLRCSRPRRQRQGRRLLLGQARSRRPHVARDRRPRQQRRVVVSVRPAAQGRALVEVRVSFFFRHSSCKEEKRWRRAGALSPPTECLLPPSFATRRRVSCDLMRDHTRGAEEKKAKESKEGAFSPREACRVAFPSLASPLPRLTFPLSTLLPPTHPPTLKNTGPPRLTGPTRRMSSPSCSPEGPRRTPW